jgi:tryptophanyl-tRNA synthetase
MRPTGRLHLGHYHGVLKNWVRLQNRYECFFFVADLHALTTQYEEPDVIRESVWEMVVDWLAAGVDPKAARLFIQSRIAEHSELHLLLSMITPLGWLERMPTYKDQQERLKEKDLATYGFLGYPVLQTADILAYKANLVPVGEDQVPHVEMSRELARRFNHLYGREPDFEEKAEAAVRALGKKNARLYRELRRRFQERGDRQALEEARALLEVRQNLTLGDRERLYGYLEGRSRILLPEPQALLTPTARVPGLDGRKMSKSYHNTISLRDEPETVAQRIRTMPTDPARVRRTDPGDPDKCPVWRFHEIYSDDKIREWVQHGCRSAAIGCLDCKQPVIDAVIAEIEGFRERAKPFQDDPGLVRGIIAEGIESARDVARQTLEEVREVMGLVYR